MADKTSWINATPAYKTWKKLYHRCHCPTSKDYPFYGARGVKVCERWRKFANFLADMGERPPGHSLDRIDNYGDYEPANCRWATQAEQVRNTRRNRFLTHNGLTLCIVDWAKKLGVNYQLISNRLKAGWSEEKTLTTKSRKAKAAR